MGWCAGDPLLRGDVRAAQQVAVVAQQRGKATGQTTAGVCTHVCIDVPGLSAAVPAHPAGCATHVAVGCHQQLVQAADSSAWRETQLVVATGRCAAVQWGRMEEAGAQEQGLSHAGVH